MEVVPLDLAGSLPAPGASSSQDTGRSTCSTTRSEYARKDPSKRVCSLGVDQEEVLIAMMFDDFMGNDCKSLDYDRVVRCAVTLQCDPDVCKVIGGTPVTEDEAWIPEDSCALLPASRAELRACAKKNRH